VFLRSIQRTRRSIPFFKSFLDESQQRSVVNAKRRLAQLKAEKTIIVAELGNFEELLRLFIHHGLEIGDIYGFEESKKMSFQNPKQEVEEIHAALRFSRTWLKVFREECHSAAALVQSLRVAHDGVPQRVATKFLSF
jgi:hypothetical protein